MEGGAKHDSRHVREAAFVVAQAVVETQGEMQGGALESCGSVATLGDGGHELYRHAGDLSGELTTLLALALATGLSDPWCEVGSPTPSSSASSLGVRPRPLGDKACVLFLSALGPQVRYNASVATRSFLTNTPPATSERFYPLLLPPTCLNR